MPILRSSPFQTLLPLVAVLLTAACLAQPEAGGQLVCGGRMRIVAPEGWQVTIAGDAGAVLRPPSPEGQPIEIVGWDVPRGGEPSPLAAATAQETLLIRTGPYARRSANKYKTAAGTAGLLLSGQVKSASGTLQEAAFAAFCEGGRYYIIGTFIGEGSGPALEGPFGQVLKTIRFETPTAASAPPAKPADPGPVATTPPDRPKPGVEALAAPPPAVVAADPATVTISLPPPMPVVSTPAADAGAQTKPVSPDNHGAVTAAAPATPPAVGDVAPPPTPVETDTFINFESPLGFRLEHPVGWKTSIVGGRIEVAVPSGDGSALPGAMVIIWPLAGVTEKQDPVALARRVLAGWDTVGGAAGSFKGRLESDTAILAGQIGTEEARRRMVVSCHVSGDTALVTALVARPGDFATRLPALTHILGSFSAGPWWTSERKLAGTTVWRDTAAGALETAIPTGWKARGGVQNYNGSWSIYLELSSDDARRLSVTWQQPITPAFRELTLVLRNLGWQEGDKYVSNPGDQPLRLLTRLSPQDFLTRHWLPNGPLRLQDPVIDRLESSADAASLVTGTNPAAIMALLHGQGQDGPRERLCLVATADAPVRLGASCWQAAILQAEAPQGHLDEAVAVLGSVIAQARPVADGPLTSKTPMFQLLAGAKQGLTALPENGSRSAVARDVLTALNGAGEGQLWLLSPGATQIWQRETRRLQSDEATSNAGLVELQPAFWQ